MKNLLFFPWVTLKNPIQINGFTLRNINDIKLNPSDKVLVETLKQMYFTKIGNPNSKSNFLNQTCNIKNFIVATKNEDSSILTNFLTEKERQLFFELKDILFFDFCINYRIPFMNSSTYLNYHSLSGYIQKIKDDNLTITSESNTTIYGDCIDVYLANSAVFLKSNYIKEGVLVSDQLFCNQIVELMSKRKNFYSMIKSYNEAYSDTPLDNPQNRVRNMVSCLEKITSEDNYCKEGKVVNKVMTLSDSVGKKIKAKDSSKKNKIFQCYPSEPELLEKTLLQIWVTDMYRIRNYNAHGNHSENFFVWEPSEHLFISSIIINILIKKLMSELGEKVNISDQEQQFLKNINQILNLSHVLVTNKNTGEHTVLDFCTNAINYKYWSKPEFD